MDRKVEERKEEKLLAEGLKTPVSMPGMRFQKRRQKRAELNMDQLETYIRKSRRDNKKNIGNCNKRRKIMNQRTGGRRK